MITNYFKSVTTAVVPDTQRQVSITETFSFDDRSPAQIRQAFDDATAAAASTSGKVSVFKNPKIVGPWTGIPFVGQGIGDLDSEVN